MYFVLSARRRSFSRAPTNQTLAMSRRAPERVHDPPPLDGTRARERAAEAGG